MTEEKLKQYIEGRRTEGASEPFKVPEGYFDTLCDRVMGQLPEPKQTIRRTLIPRVWRYAAAAVVVGIVACVGVLIPRLGNDKEAQLASKSIEKQVESISADEEYFYDVLEYSMITNNDIAYYLTEN